VGQVGQYPIADGGEGIHLRVRQEIKAVPTGGGIFVTGSGAFDRGPACVDYPNHGATPVLGALLANH
jgi:hypothetical protein